MRTEPGEQRQLLRAHDDVHRVDLDQADVRRARAARGAGRPRPVGRGDAEALRAERDPARARPPTPSRLVRLRSCGVIQAGGYRAPHGDADPTGAARARYDLTGRVAIVTGGSRGIGRAIAETYAAAGAAVVVASRKADACEQVAAEIEAAGGRAIAVPTHAGQLDQLEAPRRDDGRPARRRRHRGQQRGERARAPDRPDHPRGLGEVELGEPAGPAVPLPVRAPPPPGERPRRGVNVISAGAFTHGTYVSMYCAAKAAMITMTRAMAAEFADAGIRVNALAPGTTDTDMVRNNDEATQQRHGRRRADQAHGARPRSSPTARSTSPATPRAS